jgi:hypothetical protein
MFDHSEQLTDANLANYLSLALLEDEGWYRLPLENLLSQPVVDTLKKPFFFDFLKSIGASTCPEYSHS